MRDGRIKGPASTFLAMIAKLTQCAIPGEAGPIVFPPRVRMVRMLQNLHVRMTRIYATGLDGTHMDRTRKRLVNPPMNLASMQAATSTSLRLVA